MKQLLINALISLVTGLCFCLGVGIAMYALAEYVVDQPPQEMDYIHYPTDIHVKDVVLVAGSPKLLLRGSFENVGTKTWHRVELEALIKVDGVLVNKCSEYTGEILLPKASRTFEVRCDDADGGRLPAGTTFEVLVESAGLERKE